MIDKYVITIPEKFYIPYKGNAHKYFPNGIKPAFGSGLTIKSVNPDGSIEFYMVTDRGPNVDGPNYDDGRNKYASIIFPVPTFQP